MKRKLSIITILMIVFLVLTACNGNTNTPATDSSDTPTDSNSGTSGSSDTELFSLVTQDTAATEAIIGTWKAGNYTHVFSSEGKWTITESDGKVFSNYDYYLGNNGIYIYGTLESSDLSFTFSNGTLVFNGYTFTSSDNDGIKGTWTFTRTYTESNGTVITTDYKLEISDSQFRYFIYDDSNKFFSGENLVSYDIYTISSIGTDTISTSSHEFSFCQGTYQLSNGEYSFYEEGNSGQLTK